MSILLQESDWSLGSPSVETLDEWTKASENQQPVHWSRREKVQTETRELVGVVCSSRSNPKAWLFLQCCLLGTLLTAVVLAVILSLWLTSSPTTSKTRTTLTISMRWPRLLKCSSESISQRSFPSSFDHADDDQCNHYDCDDLNQRHHDFHEHFNCKSVVWRLTKFVWKNLSFHFSNDKCHDRQ